MPSTSYQQLKQDTELPFQSGVHNGCTLLQIEPSSPWINSFDAAGDYGRTSRQGSSASAGEWHPPLFPGPSDLTPQPYSSAPVYQPGTNADNTNNNDNSLLTLHPTLPPTVKVVPYSTYPDMRSLPPQARKITHATSYGSTMMRRTSTSKSLSVLWKSTSVRGVFAAVVETVVMIYG